MVEAGGDEEKGGEGQERASEGLLFQFLYGGLGDQSG